jgi:hypothetical protein
MTCATSSTSLRNCVDVLPRCAADTFEDMGLLDYTQTCHPRPPVLIRRRQPLPQSYACEKHSLRRPRPQDKDLPKILTFKTWLRDMLFNMEF